MNRTRKIVLGAVGLLAVGGAGGAIAATQLDSPGARSAAVVSDAAQQLGIQPSALTSALQKAEEDEIDSEVSSGELSKDQGERLKSAIASGALPLVNTPGPGSNAPGPGPGGHSHGQPGMNAFPIGPFANLDTAATYLGLTAEQVQSDLHSGQTLAQIATAQGKTADGLIAALVAAEKASLDKAVSAGKLSADQESKLASALETEITDQVNGTHPSFPGGRDFGRAPRGFGGAGAPGFGGADLTAAASYLGLTSAQIQSDLRSGQTLAQIAAAQGKTADGLIAALVAAEKANLDQQVSAGKLTADQETTILSGAQQQITNEVNGTNPGFAGGGPGPGHGHGPGAFAIPGGFGPGGNLDAAATYLGLTTDHVQSDLRSGQTLAQIATAQGKTADGLIAALVAAEKANLDQQVSAGKLTADQETTILSGAQQQITNEVNGTGRGFGGGGFGRFGSHRGGPGAVSGTGSTTTTTTSTE